VKEAKMRIFKEVLVSVLYGVGAAVIVIFFWGLSQGKVFGSPF
jgi:hypothetical protein